MARQLAGPRGTPVRSRWCQEGTGRPGAFLPVPDLRKMNDWLAKFLDALRRVAEGATVDVTVEVDQRVKVHVAVATDPEPVSARPGDAGVRTVGPVAASEGGASAP